MIVVLWAPFILSTDTCNKRCQSGMPSLQNSSVTTTRLALHQQITCNGADMCIYCPPPHVHTPKSFLIRLHLLSPTQLPIPILHEYILTLAAEHCDGKRRHRFSRRISIHPTESGAGVGARRALQQAKHKGTADQDPGAISLFLFLIPLSFSL
jgi:hypothetical protein